MCRIDNVHVGPEAVIPAHRGGEEATSNGCVSQIIQAAVDAGIARGAIADTIRFVCQSSRPWIDSGQERASDDLFTPRDIGDLEVRLHAAEAMPSRAGLAIHSILERPGDDELTRPRLTTATMSPTKISKSATSSGKPRGRTARWCATASAAFSPTRRRCIRSAIRAVLRCAGHPLSEPSPQRTPVLYQAGASSRGQRFAGQHAE